jgi:hypothetical protein
MSIKIALLKSNEEIIADVKEFISDDNKLMAYCFKNPHLVRVKDIYYDEDEGDREVDENGFYVCKKTFSIVFTPWIMLSKNKDFIVNPDWVVTVYDPDEEIETAYLEEIDGRSGNDGHDGTIGDGGGDSESSN